MNFIFDGAKIQRILRLADIFYRNMFLNIKINLEIAQKRGNFAIVILNTIFLP